MPSEPSEQLHRAIRLPQATALVVGIIIGASIFVQPSEITTRVPSVGGILLVWIVAGALTLVGALICAEWAAAFPQTGGVYVYLSKAFGPPVGFLWGWAMFWSMHSGIIAAIAVIFARYTAQLLQLGDTTVKGIAITVILLLTALNCLGVKQGSRLQTAFTLVKVVAIISIVAIGFTFGGRVPVHFVGASAPTVIGLNDFLAGLAAGLFAYGGWHMVTYSAEETVDPRRTIPRALILGTLTVTAAYVAMNAVYLYVMPLDAVARSTHVASDLADALLGRGAGNVMSGIVMFSSFGALAGVVLTGPRVYLAMAQDGLLLRWFAGIHPTFRTPSRAIIAQGIWASMLVGTGTFRALFTRVVYTEWIFFALLAVGLLRVRQHTHGGRGLMASPLLPILFAIAALAVVANAIIMAPRDTAIGLGMVLTGLPVYYFFARPHSTSPGTV